MVKRKKEKKGLPILFSLLSAEDDLPRRQSVGFLSLVFVSYELIYPTNDETASESDKSISALMTDSFNRGDVVTLILGADCVYAVVCTLNGDLLPLVLGFLNVGNGESQEHKPLPYAFFSAQPSIISEDE